MSLKKLTAKALQDFPDLTLEMWCAPGSWWTEARLIEYGYLELAAEVPQPAAAAALPTVTEAETALTEALCVQITVNMRRPASSTEEKAGAAAAVKAAQDVLTQARAHVRADATAAGVTDAAAPILSCDQLAIFKGCLYVQDLHQIIVPGLTDALDQKRFDVRYSGVYQLSLSKQTESAWECFTASQIHRFPRVDATYFDPRDEPGHIRTNAQGARAVNTYAPLKIARITGNAAPFVDHIRKILPAGNDAWILMAYLAACVQYPGVKATWAPLLQGVEGNGKSVIGEVMSRAIGREYTHQARASEIDGKFNSYLVGKLFMVFNEVRVSQDRAGVWETLKTLITDAWQQIEYKGGAIVQRELMANILFCTNHKDALPTTEDARRICPLFSAQQSVDDLFRDGMIDANRQTSVYFDALYHWLQTQDGYAITAGYLATYPIPDELNFATRCKRAPRTTATEAAIRASMGPAEQEVIEAIESGVEGFRGGWIASNCLNNLLDGSPRGRAIAKNVRRAILKTLGYAPHPGLPDGRAPTPLADGKRPTLYVKGLHHPATDLRGVAVVAAYREAQQVPVASALMPARSP